MDQACKFEAETIKHAVANKNEIGPKRIFSPLLDEARLPIVLNAMNAVIIQDKTWMVKGTGMSPISPTRRRITYRKKPRRNAAARLAILKAGVNSDCRPPQAIEIGKMPAASSS